MRNIAGAAMLGLLLAGGAPAAAEEGRVIVGEREVRRVMRFSFAGAALDWQERLVPDRTMALCAQWQNKPPKAVAEDIKRQERRKIRYPASGRLIGDWKKGQELSQSGYGLRFTDYPPKRKNGGNCYACHQLSPDEVSYGTIGVSLKGYGKLHPANDQVVRLVYDKIYNSQALIACSLMPRFGANGVLEPEEIADLVAYLLDPQSPVNK